MAMNKIVLNALVLSLASGLPAARASAQDVTFTPGHFTLEVGTPGFRVPVEARVVKGAPFSADIVTESIQTLPDGNRIVQRSTTRFYRDSAGRVRREEERDGSSPVVAITDPVAGTAFMIDPESRTARRTPNMAALHVATAVANGRALSHEPLIFNRGPFEVGHAAAPSVRNESLQERTIEGVRAQGVRRTTTIAAGAIGNELPIEIVSEEWTSPELKVLVLTEHRDPRLGTSTYRVTNINRTEPDAYLFEVPADYAVQPGEMRQLLPARPGQ